MNLPSLGKKILYFPLTRIIIGIIVIISTYGFSQYYLDKILMHSPLSTEVRILVLVIVSSVLVVSVYILLFRFYEKRKILEFSTKGLAKNLTLGFLLGALLQSLTILVIYLKGGYSVVSVNPFHYVIPPIAMAFGSAIFEETLFRGIIFRITEEKLGSYMALIISSAIFGAMHLGNPNSSLLTGIGIAIQAGLLLGAAYMYARNLWMPIALHFAWNFTQSAIFGANVSGNALSKTLINSRIEGPEWLTGGQFGPEGSVQATLFCFIVAIILIILSHKKGHVVKPFWKKSLSTGHKYNKIK